MKYIAVIALLVVPLFTQADPLTLTQDQRAVLNPPLTTFAWTPALGRDYALQEAQAAGMSRHQIVRFVDTLDCESEGFIDPAIQSGFLRPDGTQEQSYGYAQINVVAHPEITEAQAADPLFAIPWAAVHFKTDPEMWSCYGKLK